MVNSPVPWSASVPVMYSQVLYKQMHLENDQEFGFPSLGLQASMRPWIWGRKVSGGLGISRTCVIVHVICLCLCLGFYPRGKRKHQALAENSEVCWWKPGCPSEWKVVLWGREQNCKAPLTAIWWDLFSLSLFPLAFSSKTSCLLIGSTHLEWICDFQLAIQFRLLEAKGGLL